MTPSPISVGNLLLDLNNYRIGKHQSQKAAREAIIEEQGKKLVTLAEDIIVNGPSPSDLLMVIDAEDGNHNYIVIEGNRRLTAITLLLKPELAEGTNIHTAFKRLSAAHADRIPKVLFCVIMPSKKAGLVWINRKHASGLEGAGTEPWTSVAKARADAEQGIARPDLDTLNFVLTKPDLSESLRTKLQGSDFNITTLRRLVESKEMQQSVGYSLRDGKFVAEQDKDRVMTILSDVVTVIATGSNNGKKFTERDIDSLQKREDFVAEIVERGPRKKKADAPWVISGAPTIVKKPVAKKPKPTPSTDEQPNLIPKGFKLQLPSGKINDIYVELKRMDIVGHRLAISVLFRVFLELSLDEYIKHHSLPVPTDKLRVRLQHVKTHLINSGVAQVKELKAVQVALGVQDSLVSPDTLHSYVHSKWMNPDPLNLKLCWSGFQVFFERMWASMPPGNP